MREARQEALRLSEAAAPLILTVVQEVALPQSSTPGNRSVAACIAAILEADVGAVPLPPAEHPEPWTVWRNWLGQSGLGLVPVADPVDFNWPGPWLALVPAAESDEALAVVAFGSPPGIAWAPLPTRAFEQVRRGFVIAPMDVALRGQEMKPPTTTGAVSAILIAPEAEGDLHRVDHAVAEAGRGLVGDRYHVGAGTFSNPNARGHDLTLIEQGTIDDMASTFPDYRAEDARRNIVTTGIGLNDLVGWRFRVGEVECLGQRLCEPCAHLDRIAVVGALRPLVHRAGLRADIVTGGTIAIGDAIEPLAPAD